MNGGAAPGRLDARKMLVFFARLLVISLALYTVWNFIGRFYTMAVAYGAKPLVALTGNSLDVERALNVSEEISLNPVVYISLVAAVTGAAWKKRIRPAVIGVLILTAANIVVVFLMFMSAFTRNEQLWTGTEFVNLTINFFLPILLWVLLAPKGSLMPVSSSSG